MATYDLSQPNPGPILFPEEIDPARVRRIHVIAVAGTGMGSFAGLLQQAGYQTAIVGKWHLGLGPEGGPDWNGEIKPSPLDIGFDYCFIMAATGDRVPTVYIENLPMILIKLRQGYRFEGFHPDHERPGWHEYSFGKLLT